MFSEKAFPIGNPLDCGAMTRETKESYVKAPADWKRKHEDGLGLSVELGSGAGFFKEVVPEALGTEGVNGDTE